MTLNTLDAQNVGILKHDDHKAYKTMNPSDDLEYQLDTLAIRTGHDRTFEGEHSEPIFLTSSFVCESAADAAAKFSGQIAGNTYSRLPIQPYRLLKNVWLFWMAQSVR